MTEKTNILLIQTDQLSACSLGLYGNPVVRTPTLEKLAEEGVLFTQAFCNYPACVPSRSSMLTGRYAHTIRSHANFIHLNPEERTIVHHLKDNGYQTALIGKNHAFADGRDHWVFPATPSKPTFQEDVLHALFDYVVEADHGHRVEGYEDDPDVMAAHKWSWDHCWRAPLSHGTNPYPREKSGSYLLGETAVNYLKDKRESEKPFFLWLSYPDPHTPYQAPEPYASMYDPKDVPLPPKDDLDTKPERQKVAHLMDAMDKADDALIRQVRAIHYGMINAIDDSIKKVLVALEDLGLRESTIVVFTADHGDSMGAHGLIQKHNAFYDTFTQVPLIVSWPGHVEPQTSEDLVELLDLAPTLLELLGLEPIYGVQGRSLKPLLEGDESHEPREFVVIESGEAGEPMKVSDISVKPEGPLDGSHHVWCAYQEAWTGKGKCIRTKEWKYCLYENGDAELYDLRNDPDELVNLSDDANHREIVADMERKLLRWCIRTEDTIPKNTTVFLNYR